MQTVAVGVVLALGLVLALRGLARPGRVEPEALLALRALGGGTMAAMGVLALAQGAPSATLVAGLAALPLLAPLTVRRARTPAVAARAARTSAPGTAPAVTERRAA